jgi:hypothetical protein
VSDRLAAGALLIDTRPVEQRVRDGEALRNEGYSSGLVADTLRMLGLPVAGVRRTDTAA